jgi:hypothetical protein
MKKPTPLAVLLAGLAVTSALLAYEAGGIAYTKRVETVLLAEPKPLATATGKLAFGKKVKIEQVQGPWLRVSDGPVSGWVFNGSLTDVKPSEGKGLDGVPLLASKTTATAAARPLTDATIAYAQEKNLGDAQGDLEWVVAEAKAITPEEVDAYLQEHKKGEYQ